MKYRWQQRFRAFVHALRGGQTLWRTQAHAKFHLLATVIVLCSGVLYHIDLRDWALLLGAIGMVWVAEALNSAIEFLADELSLEWRERIMHAKDMAAFAVLVAAWVAMAIGAMVFLPHVLASLAVDAPASGR